MVVKCLVTGKPYVGGFFLLKPVKVDYEKKTQGNQLHWKRIKLPVKII